MPNSIYTSAAREEVWVRLLIGFHTHRLPLHTLSGTLHTIRPLMAMGIGFTAHTVMFSVPLGHSSCSTSLETDISTADISLLPSSVGSATDLANRAGTDAAMDISTTASMDAASETPSEGTIIDQKERDDE